CMSIIKMTSLITSNTKKTNRYSNIFRNKYCLRETFPYTKRNVTDDFFSLMTQSNNINVVSKVIIAQRFHGCNNVSSASPFPASESANEKSTSSNFCSCTISLLRLINSSYDHSSVTP